MAICCVTQEARHRALWQPRGVGGRGFRREGTYVYPWLVHVDEWQKWTQYSKVNILLLKKIFFNECVTQTGAQSTFHREGDDHGLACSPSLLPKSFLWEFRRAQNRKLLLSSCPSPSSEVSKEIFASKCGPPDSVSSHFKSEQLFLCDWVADS